MSVVQQKIKYSNQENSDCFGFVAVTFEGGLYKHKHIIVMEKFYSQKNWDFCFALENTSGLLVFELLGLVGYIPVLSHAKRLGGPLNYSINELIKCLYFIQMPTV